MSDTSTSCIRISAEPEPITIDLLKTAVLVVDMQNAFVREGGYFDLIGADISGIINIIPACQKIIAAARSRGTKIFYLQMAYSDAHLLDVDARDSAIASKTRSLKLARRHPELRDKLCFEGTWGAQIIDELKPEPGDIVVRKSRYDGFSGTDLDAVLSACNIRYLIFTGTATNICIESTLRRSFFRGYFPILVSDAAVQKGGPQMQAATITNVIDSFGWVTDTERLITAINHSVA